MSQISFTVRILIDGAAATGLTVRMSDPDGLYGIKRNDTDEAVVADATAMTEIGGGVYSHSFDAPAEGLRYTGWVEYEIDGELYRFSNVFDGPLADSGSAAAADSIPWQSVICYEDRGGQFHSSAWRLWGVNTATDGNTDNGRLHLAMSRQDDIVTARLYKAESLAVDSLVASGSCTISPLDGGAEYVDCSLSAEPGGVSGAFRLHRYVADGHCPLVAALCTDADLSIRYQGIADLSIFDEVHGLSSVIRVAGEEVLARVASVFAGPLGGAAGDWWARDGLPDEADLSRIANPGGLRALCALKALELALGREHEHAGDSVFMQLSEHFAARCEQAFTRLRLAINGTNRRLGGDADVPSVAGQSHLRLSRA